MFFMVEPESVVNIYEWLQGVYNDNTLRSTTISCYAKQEKEIERQNWAPWLPVKSVTMT
jgi:hypothetical protein